MTDNGKKQAILKLLVEFKQKGACPDTSDLINAVAPALSISEVNILCRQLEKEGTLKITTTKDNNRNGTLIIIPTVETVDIFNTGKYKETAENKSEAYQGMKCKDVFITDFNELCNTCWIREKVASVRANMILKFETLKSINTDEYVIEHLKKEIKHDNEVIAKMLNIENQGWVEFRENRVGLYHSYIDCVKYYTEQLKIIEAKNNNTPETMETVTNNNTIKHSPNVTEIPYSVDEVYFIGDKFSIGAGIKEESGIFQVHIGDGNKEYIAKAKNESVKQEYENWYWNCYNTKELHDEMDVKIIKYKKRIALNQLAVLLNDSSKFDISIPIEKIELLELKKEFDKINSYPEKLKWWGEKGFYLNCGHSLMLTDFGSENVKEENHLTIYPKTDSEIRLYNEFCFNEYRKSNYPSCNEELLKNKYYQRLEAGANPIEFTSREIAKQKERYSRTIKINKEKCNDSPNHLMYHFFVTGYDASTDGTIKEIFQYKGYINKMMEIAQGYSSERYVRFLNTQLGNDTVPPIQIPKSTVAKPSIDPLLNESNVELVNTINEYLDDFKSAFKSDADYTKAVRTIQDFFEGKKPTVSQSIFISNGNKKKLAKQLGMLYRMEKNEPISVEYLTLLKNLFSVFIKENIAGKELNKTNLYKYCTTKKKY